MQMCYFKNSWMIVICSDGCKQPTWTRFEKDNFKLHFAPALLQLRIQVRRASGGRRRWKKKERIQVSGEIAKGQDKESIYLKVRKLHRLCSQGPVCPTFSSHLLLVSIWLWTFNFPNPRDPMLCCRFAEPSWHHELKLPFQVINRNISGSYNSNIFNSLPAYYKSLCIFESTWQTWITHNHALSKMVPLPPLFLEKYS